jgi:hypothetical protein
VIRHYTVRGKFKGLPAKQKQVIAQTFIDYVEQRMSAQRKAKHHGKIVAYVWRALKAGRPYVMEKEVLAFIRRYEKAEKTRRQRIAAKGPQLAP